MGRLLVRSVRDTRGGSHCSRCRHVKTRMKIKMGNFPRRPQKNTQLPRDVFEVAESVEFNEDIEEAVRRNSWAKSFLLSPALIDPVGGKEKRETFLFLVAATLLSKIKDQEKAKLTKLLEAIRLRFFSDDQFYKSTIGFKDIKGLVDKIFKIYYEEGVEANVVQLKEHLTSLRQDKAIRSSLEPSFGTFLKTPRLHPGNIIQNCILS